MSSLNPPNDSNLSTGLTQPEVSYRGRFMSGMRSLVSNLRRNVVRISEEGLTVLNDDLRSEVIVITRGQVVLGAVTMLANRFIDLRMLHLYIPYWSRVVIYCYYIYMIYFYSLVVALNPYFDTSDILVFFQVILEELNRAINPNVSFIYFVRDVIANLSIRHANTPMFLELISANLHPLHRSVFRIMYMALYRNYVRGYAWYLSSRNAYNSTEGEYVLAVIMRTALGQPVTVAQASTVEIEVLNGYHVATAMTEEEAAEAPIGEPIIQYSNHYTLIPDNTSTLPQVMLVRQVGMAEESEELHHVDVTPQAGYVTASTDYSQLNDPDRFPLSEKSSSEKLLSSFNPIERIRANRLITRGILYHEKQVKIVKQIWSAEIRKRAFKAAINKIARGKESKRPKFFKNCKPQAGPLLTLNPVSSVAITAAKFMGYEVGAFTLVKGNVMEALTIDLVATLSEHGLDILKQDLIGMEQAVYIILKLSASKTWMEFIDTIYMMLLFRDKIGITTALKYIKDLPLFSGYFPQADLVSTTKTIGQLLSSQSGRSIVNAIYGLISYVSVGWLNDIKRVEKLILLGLVGSTTDPDNDPLGAIITGCKTILDIVLDNAKFSAILKGDFQCLLMDKMSREVLSAYDVLREYDTVVSDNDMRLDFEKSLQSLSLYSGRLTACRDRITKCIDLKHPINSLLTTLLSKIDDALSNLDKLKDNIPREVPFAMSLVGPPASGKSSLLPKLLSVLSQSANLPDNPAYHFYTSADKFNCAGISLIHHTIIEDDAQTVNANIMSSSDVVVNQRLNRVNVTAFKPKQPVAGDKGDSFAHSIDMVLSNDPYLNGKNVLEPDATVAMLRRYIHVRMDVNPKYMRDGGISIDPAKVPPGCDDLQTFNIYRAVPVAKPRPECGGLAMDWIFLHRDIKSTKQFFQIAESLIKEHREQQYQLVKKLITGPTLCWKCNEPYVPHHVCQPTPQADYTESISLTINLLSFIMSFSIVMFVLNAIKTISVGSIIVRMVKSNLVKLKDTITDLSIIKSATSIVGTKSISNIIKFISIRRKMMVAAPIALVVIGFAYQRFKAQQVEKAKPQVSGSTDYPKRSTSLNITPFTNIIKSSNYTDVVNSVSKSMRRLFVNDGIGIIHVNAFPIKPDLLATVRHALPKNYRCKIKIFNADDTLLSSNVEIELDETMVVEISEDYVAFKCGLQFKSIAKWIPNVPTVPIGSETVLIRSEVIDGKFRVVTEKSTVLNTLAIKYEKNTIKYSHDVTFETTTEGANYCGGLYVSNIGGHGVVCGMHIAEGRGNGYAKLIANSDEKFWKGQIKYLSLEVQPQAIINLQPIHAKSYLFQCDGSAEIYGSFGHKNKMRSHLRHTLIHEALTERGVLTDFTFPKFDYNTHGSEIPLDATYSNLYPTISLKPVPRMHFCKASQAFKNYLSKQRLVNDWRGGILSVHESLNGVFGVKGMDGLKMDTSVGFGHTGIKRDYLVSSRPNAQLTPEIEAEVNKIHELLKEGTYDPPVLKCSLKDEVKKEGKLPRLFMAAPMANTIVFRQYFLPIVHLIQSNPWLFRIMIGCNPHGPDWGKLKNRLFRHKFQFAGDYKKFDKKQHRIGIQEIADFLAWLSQEFLGYSDIEACILYTFILTLANSILYANGDLFKIFGGNPSGNPATTIVNSLYNLFMYIAACLDCDIDWETHDIGTYGDDIVAGHDDQDFTQPFFQSFVMENFSLQYVDPSAKDELDVPDFTPPQGVTFLGRGFGKTYALWDNGEMVLSPLKLESIYKMLHFEPDHLDPFLSLRCRHSEAILELSQHEDYETLVKPINDAIRTVTQVNEFKREEILDMIYNGDYVQLLSPVFL